LPIGEVSEADGRLDLDPFREAAGSDRRRVGRTKTMTVISASDKNDL
jgi:hypothetical protein